jgi:cyclopropane fatty-acyl-phospholipid synthase-like methyltransferase
MAGAALKMPSQQPTDDASDGVPPPRARRLLPARVRAWWQGPTPGRHPFKVRLHAWWEGLVLPPPAPAPEVTEKGNPKEPALSLVKSKPKEPEDGSSAAAIDPWTQERVELLESVFGGGALTPGGIAAVLQLVRPLGLDQTMSILEFGAGIGGATRAIAEEFGAWVTGIESSAVLVEIAGVRAQTGGMAKKAPVLQESLDAPEIRARYYNAIYSRDALYPVGKKDALMGVLVQGLRPKGQITFIDYVAADDLALVSSEIAAWKKTEPLPVHLWTAERYRQALTMQKLDVRTVEDITEEVRRDIISAWGNYLKTLDMKALGSSSSATLLVREAELWAARFKALASGRLKVVRIYAMKR